MNRNAIIVVSMSSALLLSAGCGRPKPPDPSVVLSKMSDLATLRCEFDVVSFMKHEVAGVVVAKCLTRGTGSSLLAIDLAKTECEVRNDGKIIEFKLPEVEVVSPTLDSTWDKIASFRGPFVTETKFNEWRTEEERKTQGRIGDMSADPALCKLAKGQAAALIKGFYAKWPEITVIVK